MTQPSDYALLAAGSYWDIRLPNLNTNANNRAPLPAGWEVLTQFDKSDSGVNALTGFSARVYRNTSTGEIVISYGGTEFGNTALQGTIADFTNGNIPLAIGRYNEQAYKAALLYQEVKAAGMGSNISFTGHSLGGGLASIMAVWFDRPAYVFAPAPFQLAADSYQSTVFPDSLSALVLPNVRSRLGETMDEALRAYNPETDFSVREQNVKAWAIKGELLESTLGALNWIEGQSTALYDKSDITLTANDKHSIDLHAAALLSPNFEIQAKKLPNALTLVMDPFLYGGNVLGNQQLFVTKLLRNEVGIHSDSGVVLQTANGMLSHFANDLQKLGTNIEGLTKAAQDALIAQGIEWYYWQKSDYAGQEFFTSSGGSLQYATAVGDSLPGAQNKASLYVDKWLTPILNANDEFGGNVKFDEWNVGVNVSGSSATARHANKTQIFIGNVGADIFMGGDKADLLMSGDGNDILNGGAGTDRLYGNAGDDTLEGGADDDDLQGGGGNDSYVFGIDGGRDTVFDSDGIGEIKFAGRTLNGSGTLVSDTATQASWKDASQPDAIIIYVWNKVSKELRISGGGAAGLNSSVVIKNYADNALGIHAPAVAAPVQAPERAEFDFAAPGGRTSYMRTVDANGNVTEPSPGTLGAVALRNLAATGNMEIAGGKYNDIMEGGTLVDLNPNYAPHTSAMHGLDGNDKLYAVTAQTVEEALGNSLGYSNIPTDAQLGAGWASAHPYAEAIALDGGAGNDTLIGSSLNDTLFGGDGDDVIVGGSGNDIILSDGDIGNIIAEGGSHRIGENTSGGTPSSTNHALLRAKLYGFRIQNTIQTPSGPVIRTDNFADAPSGGYLGDTAYFSYSTGSGGRVFDYMDPLGSYDLGGFSAISGGYTPLEAEAWGEYFPSAVGLQGATLLAQSNQNAELPWWYGVSSTDPLNSQARSFNTNRYFGNDVVYAGTGDDIVNTGGGVDFVYAGSGIDFVAGYSGDDYIFGEDDNDYLWGDEASVLNTATLGDTVDRWTGISYGKAGLPAFDLYGQDYLDGGKGNDVLVGGGNSDTLLGGDGADWLYGDDVEGLLTSENAGDDYLDGGEGADRLFGGLGNDILVVGAGDKAQGGAGDDVYFVSGNSELTDYAGKNIYQIDAAQTSAITLKDFSQGGGRLEVINAASGSVPELTFENGGVLTIGGLIISCGSAWLDGSLASVSVNGKIYRAKDLLQASPTPRYVTVSGGAQEVVTGSGSDYIVVVDGGHIVSSGQGYDAVQFLSADNILEFHEGDISEQVTMAEGVTESASTALTLALDPGTDLSLLRIGLAGPVNNRSVVLFLTPDGLDTISLQAADADIETFLDRFAITAGTQTTTLAQLLANGQVFQGNDNNNELIAFNKASVLNGLGGNDMLTGSIFDDVLDGGTGDDVMAGGGGNDTYKWGRGYGNDTLVEEGGADVLMLTNLLETDVAVSKDSSGNLTLRILDSGEELVMAAVFVSEYDRVIKKVVFSNGVEWGIETLKLLTLVPTGSDDDIAGFDGDDHLTGGGGNDYLSGNGGNDLLEGDDGNDNLQGGQGDDRLVGGAGNDNLTGGYGNDTFVWGIGQGNDTIYDMGGGAQDTLELTGLNPGDVTGVRYNGGETVLTTTATGETISITQNFYGLEDYYYTVERLVFSDGTVWGVQDQSFNFLLKERDWLPGSDLYGWGLADHIVAGASGNRMYGLAGNDYLEGGDAADTLAGGAGDDRLSGGLGDDIYQFSFGDGHDTIEGNDSTAGKQDVLSFEGDIVKPDVTASRIGDDMVLTLGAGADSITIKGWFDGTIFNKIEQVHFTDGTSWSAADLDALFATTPPIGTGVNISGTGTVQGTAYDDVLTSGGYGTHLIGGAGNDVLTVPHNTGTNYDNIYEGGVGDDTLIGSYAKDTYLFNLGDGHDTITDDVRFYPNYAGVAYFLDHPNEAAYQDRIEFGAGIAKADVTASRAGNDMVLTLSGGTDSITIKGWFDGTILNKIEQISFADSTGWSATDLDALFGIAPPPPTTGVTLIGTGTVQGTAYDDVLTAGGSGTHLIGGAGNDTLTVPHDNGTNWNNVYEGGTGDDTLIGSYAKDTYLFNLGDGHDTITDDVRFYPASYGVTYYLEHPDEAAYQDRIEFGAGIAKADVTASRAGIDMVLTLSGGTDSITIKGWFDGTIFNKIEEIHFADGTSWAAADLDAMFTTEPTGVNLSGAGTLVGTQYDDVLTAMGAWNNHLIGGAGNDVLTVPHYSQSIGGTTYEGGEGDDTLIGSYVKDTYVFNAGDGHDTITDDLRFWPDPDLQAYFLANPDATDYQDQIVFGEGIGKADVTVSRIDNDMVLSLADGADSITIKDWYDGTIFNRIEAIHFADGSNWSAVDLELIVDPEPLPNNAPVLEQALQDQSLMETRVWSYTVPQGTFSDADGEELTYGASLANGDDLPSWISFDSATQTFSGIPAEGDAGTSLSFTVSATDASGATATSSFELLIVALTSLSLTGGGLLQGTRLADSLTANQANSSLIGYAGNDVLVAQNDISVTDLYFEGGIGDDILVGNYASDLYLFNRGDGHDTIIDDETRLLGSSYPETTPQFTDGLVFGAGTSTDQVWFRQDGNDLDISIIGTEDHISVKDWYLSAFNQIEQIHVSGEISRYIASADVNNLVQAMAAFAPPAPGETTLSSSYSSVLAPVIAANWQTVAN